MPYPVKSFTYVTKYYSNFLSLIYCFCKGITYVYELIDSRIFWCEARLVGRDKSIRNYVIVQVFKNTSFKDLSDTTY